MIPWKEVKAWAEECSIADHDMVWIGEGGITLEAEGPEGEELYIEIGGKPEED